MVLDISKEDHMYIQQSGKVSERAINEVNRSINRLTGLKISSSTATLKAFTNPKMPNYIIE
jgi:hypothetical protein